MDAYTMTPAAHAAIDADAHAAWAAIVARRDAAMAERAADVAAHHTIAHMIGDADASSVSHAAMAPGDVIYWGDDPRRGVYAADYSVLRGVVPDMAADVVRGVMESTR